MIATAYSARPNANLRGRIADLARLGGVRFDRVEATDFCVVAACGAGRVDERGPLASIGAEVTLESMSDASLFRGPFAFAAARERELRLGCGRFGGHPLYFSREADGSIVACSRLDPLARLRENPPLRETAIAELAVGLPGGSHTVYANVERVRAAEIIRFGADGEIRSRLPALRPTPTPFVDPREMSEELLRIIDAAIAHSIGRAKRVAVSVGGLDSSGLLAALLARSRGASKPEVLAVTLHFAGLNDDRPYVRDLCRALGIEAVRVTPADCAKYFLDPIVIDGAPNVHPQAPWSLETARWARAQDADLILRGDGGDEFFNGDTDVFAATALEGRPIHALREVSRLKGVPEFGSPLRRVNGLLLRPLARKKMRALHGWIKAARRRKRASSEFSWIRPGLGPALDDLLQWDRTKDLAGGDLMREVREFYQQCLVATGCPAALPYYDEELVAFVQGLPGEALFYGGYKRGLFRFAFKDLLPDLVRLRETKSGFGDALASTFEAAGGAERIEPYLDLRYLSELDLVDAREFRRHVRELVLDPTEPRRWLRLWPVIAMEAYLRAVREGTSGRVAAAS